jgi:hypothetical protein
VTVKSREFNTDEQAQAFYQRLYVSIGVFDELTMPLLLSRGRTPTGGRWNDLWHCRVYVFINLSPPFVTAPPKAFPFKPPVLLGLLALVHAESAQPHAGVILRAGAVARAGRVTPQASPLRSSRAPASSR